MTIASSRVHATTQGVVDDHFAEERPHLLPLPLRSYDAVLTVERRIRHEGISAVGGNQYEPCQTRPGAASSRSRTIRPRCGNQRRVDPRHRKPVPIVRRAASLPTAPVDATVARRPLAFYEAVGRRLANAPEDRRP